MLEDAIRFFTEQGELKPGLDSKQIVSMTSPAKRAKDDRAEFPALDKKVPGSCSTFRS